MKSVGKGEDLSEGVFHFKPIIKKTHSEGVFMECYFYGLNAIKSILRKACWRLCLVSKIVFWGDETLKKKEAHYTTEWRMILNSHLFNKGLEDQYLKTLSKAQLSRIQDIVILT